MHLDDRVRVRRALDVVESAVLAHESMPSAALGHVLQSAQRHVRHGGDVSMPDREQLDPGAGVRSGWSGAVSATADRHVLQPQYRHLRHGHAGELFIGQQLDRRADVRR